MLIIITMKKCVVKNLSSLSLSFIEQLVSREDHQARGLQPSDDGYLPPLPLALLAIDLFFKSSSIKKNGFASLSLKVGQVCSFLLRPSDNTPGDYSLFFRTNENIQRFKISPTPNNQYMMGGRYYNRYDRAS